MKKLPSIALAALASLLSACGSDSGTDPQTLETLAFQVPLKDGQTRLVEKLLIDEGKKYRRVMPVLAFIEVAKDTTIGGKTGKLVRTTAWQYGKDSIYEHRMRQLVVDEVIRLSVYELPDSSALGLWYGLFKKADYDTNIFFDRNTVAPFPLVAGRKWNIRDPSDRFYFEVLEKEYTGKDTLEWGGEKRECLVFDQRFLGARARSWVASIGLIKAEMEYEGPNVVTDDDGVELDTTETRESFALIALDPDPARIAAAKETSRKKFFDNRPKTLLGGDFPDHP